MNSKRQTVRDNHYVPQFYLKQWSSNGHSILCYDTAVRDDRQSIWRRVAIKGTACWKDFYTQHRNGTIDDSIELFIEQNYETPAKMPLKKLVQGETLLDNELSQIVDFAILQMDRTPSWYFKANDVIKDVFPAVSHESIEGVLADFKANRINKILYYDGYVEEHNRDPFPNPPIERRLDSEKSEIVTTISIGRESYLASLGRLLRGEIARVMKGYVWSILEMPDPFEFPTSDNPFVRLENYGKRGYSLDGGIGRHNADLFMPLTPKHLLFTEVGVMSKVDSELLEDESTRNLFVKAIVENALRYVYSKTEDENIVAMRPRIVDPNYDNQMRESMLHWDELQS